MQKFQNYHDAVRYLEGLANLPLKEDYMSGPARSEIFLKRMRYFLDLLGNPDRGLKFIHITGTAGKGTVTNMVHEIIHASGKKVGSFTSPYVTTSIEKIKVGDKYISPNEFSNIVEYLKPFIDEAHLKSPYGAPSIFEIFLAIGLIYFKKEKCQFVVLEVGLGGRHDATNVIERPLVTAVTNIDYDHVELLGRTLKKIAYDKAGIIKKGSVFITSEQRPELIKMFEKICGELKVKMVQVKHQNSYQEYNEALATSISKNLGISDSYIKRGIKKARLPARFELMQSKPQVILDGAHNRSKIRSTILNLKKMQFRKLFLVLAIAESKDHASILSKLIPLADGVYITRFQIIERKCADPKELFQKSKRYLKRGAEMKTFLDPERALAKAFKEAKDSDVILITGSFFLARDLRKKWYPEEWVLKNRKSLS